ncbi:VOC family protein [Alteromonas ponticola]|uniref:VOC family protein n=1 Tax=Alteromonas aquimaris TaxID=2998417 RepID=A0ABT3PAC5_9ALTE|nr:VOC family protein [Alteromonas aquimaris]MCW8109724.1 VOC family protein [Alteromonas aquimaris]
MKIKSLCGVIIAANNPKALAAFYSHVFAVNFEEEDHGGLDVHYGVDIGQIHLGIHPAKNLGKTEVGNASISIAYNVDSLSDIASRLAQVNAVQVTPPHDEGFGLVASYKDPEGNPFEVVELNYAFAPGA